MKGFLIFLLIVLCILAGLLVNRNIRLRRRKINTARLAAKNAAQKAALPAAKEEPLILRTDTQEFRYLRNVLGCYVPDLCRTPSAPLTESIELTEAEAVAQGFSFRKKSRVVRITNYHGSAETLTIPHCISGKIVNKIGNGAFAGNMSLRHVEIPASVIRIGERAFAESALETCVLSDRMQEIPAEAFLNCRRLHTVHLPEMLLSIGERAFAGCKALHHVTFPIYCREFGDYAFGNSGLSGFTLIASTKFGAGAGVTQLSGSKWISHAYLNNGAAFCHTPLHKNYPFVLASPSTQSLRILLCGSKAMDKLHFPAHRDIQLGRGSLEFTNVKVFDLSRCPKVSVHPEAFFPHQWHDGFMSQRRNMRVIVPKNCSELCFPAEVSVTYADGSVCENRALYGTWDVEASVQTGAASILSYGMHGKVSAMEIIPEQERMLIRSGYHAFVTPELASLKAPLARNSAEVFSTRCRSLRRVEFTENGETIVKYIPDRSLIGSLHKELLTAFRGDEVHFFDRSVYDRVFLRGTYTWHDGSIRPLSQKQRLLMCFDVLRSTQRAHEEKPYIYIAYLVGHLRYARKLCKKIEPTHPEYLRWLAAQNPTEWFAVYPEAKRYLVERMGR